MPGETWHIGENAKRECDAKRAGAGCREGRGREERAGEE